MKRQWFVLVIVPAVVLASVIGMSAAASASSRVAKSTTPHIVRPGVFQPGGLISRPGGGLRGYTSPGTVKSTNWSGYALNAANHTFTSVSATWTAPAATCSSSQGQYASFWVGLDGYKSQTVEQTGTDSDCNGTTPSYYGWYEMYPAFPVNFTNPVSPGDVISASVTFSGTETYTLVLKDTTQGWTHTVTKNESGLDRSSAEVITEAPSSGNGVLPLADFGKVKYKNSMANGVSMGTQSPIEIVMDDSKGIDKDSTGAITSAGNFHNKWIRST